MKNSFIYGSDKNKDLDLLLVNTPLRDYGDRPRVNDYTLPVIGMGYIATYAASRGYNVGLLDAEAHGLSHSDTIKYINESNPRWAGFGLLAPTYDASANIASKLDPDIKLMLGGHQAKAMPQAILQDPRLEQCSALILGEGETRAAELLADEMNRERLPNIMRRDKSGAILKSNAPNRGHLAPDVNALPYVDRKYFVQDPYVDDDGRYHANMVAARGCPYDCSFCGAAVSANEDITIRVRTVENVIGEMALLNSRGVSRYRFVDDLFLGAGRVINSMMDGFSREKIGEWAEWSGTGRINVFDRISDEKLSEMHKNGLREVALGIESGNEEILEKIDKRISPVMTKRVVSKLLQHGIGVKGYFILGFLGETESQINDTVRLIEDLWSVSDNYEASFRASIFEFRPYPGTLDWDRIIKTKRYAPDQLMNYTHIDMTDNGDERSMYGRDEFNFSTNLQIADAPIDFIREKMAYVVKEQYERSKSK